MLMSDLKPWLKAQQKLVDAELRRQLPRENVRPTTIHKAMRYSIFAGGKRLKFSNRYRSLKEFTALQAC